MKIAFIASHSLLNVLIAKNISMDGHEVTYYEEQVSMNSQLMKIFRKKIPFIQKLDQVLFLFLVVVFSQLSLMFNLSYFIRLVLNLSRIKLYKRTKIQTNILNDKKFVKTVINENYDLVILLGCSILKENWFKHDIPLINAHPGFLPYYRGRFCWLWPFLNFDYDKVGFTIHKVNKEIDVGEIYFQKNINPKIAQNILNPAFLYKFYFFCTIFGIRKIVKGQKPIKNVVVDKSLPIYSEGRSISILRFVLRKIISNKSFLETL